MENTFERTKSKNELTQSSFFGKHYADLLEKAQGNVFTSPLFADISNIYNKILFNYDCLTAFQKNMLAKIFDEINNIKVCVDPDRLQPFEYLFNEDNELVLFRNTNLGLTNIVINSDELITFSYISKVDNNKVLYFLEENGDFVKLAYHFFSY